MHTWPVCKQPTRPMQLACCFFYRLQLLLFGSDSNEIEEKEMICVLLLTMLSNSGSSPATTIVSYNLTYAGALPPTDGYEHTHTVRTKCSIGASQ